MWLTPLGFLPWLCPRQFFPVDSPDVLLIRWVGTFATKLSYFEGPGGSAAGFTAPLTEVIFLANKLIISEYNIRAARGQDPRLPSSLLQLTSPGVCVCMLSVLSVYPGCRGWLPTVIGPQAVDGLPDFNWESEGVFEIRRVSWS